jgi:rsbT co-antagonist protein RsbR
LSQLADLERRIAAIEIAIAAAATGDFELRLEIVEDDELSSVESSINVMLESLQALFEENRRKHAEIEQSLATITEQRAAIRELSTPVLEVWDDVLVMPIMGTVDIPRCVDIMSNLLQAVGSSRARYVILDLTGVASIDHSAADGLIKVVQGARLLGARCVLTGLSPALSQTLAHLDVPTAALRTLRNLKAGLRDAIAHLRHGKTPAI